MNREGIQSHDGQPIAHSLALSTERAVTSINND